MRRILQTYVGGVLLLGGVGCADFETQTRKNEPARFDAPMPNYQHATVAVAARVDGVGRKVLNANADTGLRPLMTAVGKKEVAVFHHGTSGIFVTEGLADQCKSDDELAAVICVEMGRMIAERESKIPSSQREYREEPPERPRFNDSLGASHTPDQTDVAELAKFEKSRTDRGRGALPPPPPDPRLLARRYMKQSGYDPEALARVEPLLRTAEANPGFDDFVKPASGTRGGSPMISSDDSGNRPGSPPPTIRSDRDGSPPPKSLPSLPGERK